MQRANIADIHSNLFVFIGEFFFMAFSVPLNLFYQPVSLRVVAFFIPFCLYPGDQLLGDRERC